MKKDLSNKKIITMFGILLGTLLEWYDFSLFASMATIIGDLFFPSKIPLLSLLAAFGVFASGFVMRPLGAVIFGHIGDKYGRKNTLSLTIILMVLPTTCIGLLPTHQQVGLLAPLALILLRLIQGAAASGEYPGAICFLTEIAAPHRRGLCGSLSMIGVAGGLLLGTLVNLLLLSVISHEQMYAWGWRIPFLLGFPLGLVGWYLRYKAQESDVFKSAQLARPVHKFPVKHVFTTDLANLIKLTCLFSLSTVSFYLSFVYVASYLVSTHAITLHQSLVNNIWNSVALIMLMPIFGLISDKTNRKYVMLLGALCLFIFLYPIFILLLSNNLHKIIAGQVLLALFIAMLTGPMGAISSEIFSTLTRYTGVAIALNIGASIFGGTCPLIATFLVQHFANVTIPCVYPMMFAFISLIAIASLKHNSNFGNE